MDYGDLSSRLASSSHFSSSLQLSKFAQEEINIPFQVIEQFE